MSEDYQQIEFRLSIMSDPNSRDAAEAIRDLRERLAAVTAERDEARAVVDQLSGVLDDTIKYLASEITRITKERDEARAELAGVTRDWEGLNAVCSKQMQTLAGHEATLTSARLQGRIEGMEILFRHFQKSPPFSFALLDAIDEQITAARAELEKLK
jgi:chromosome segregation ATPase